MRARLLRADEERPMQRREFLNTIGAPAAVSAWLTTAAVEGGALHLEPAADDGRPFNR